MTLSIVLKGLKIVKLDILEINVKKQHEWGFFWIVVFNTGKFQLLDLINNS